MFSTFLDQWKVAVEDVVVVAAADVVVVVVVVAFVSVTVVIADAFSSFKIFICKKLGGVGKPSICNF